MAGEENYEKSLINSKIYGALILFVCHCGCSLHAGIYGDVSQEKGGNLIEYYYTSYFFIKVNLVDFINEEEKKQKFAMICYTGTKRAKITPFFSKNWNNKTLRIF